ncbi:YccS family putative transporter [Pseudomonas sp. F1_0610]|uniref:YccS family putative transporter n=1 Tax=Pseudomonas sp. F1_0610 TaxID=3114284 RepID=UPI0039C195A9
MTVSRLSLSLRRLWAFDKFGPSVRFFIALAGCMLWSWWQGPLSAMIPLFLGVIASALAESDDTWQGRLFALMATLICFAITAISVELVYPYPWLFAIFLFIISFSLTMLGAVAERYATIAQASLILSVYTMIGLEQNHGVSKHFGQDTIYLLFGAAWYGLISVIWHGLFNQQPLQLSLARLFRAQCQYLKAKSNLFEPLRNLNLEERRIALAQQNGKVVEALNHTKTLILHRVSNARSKAKIGRYLKLYFLAQDIHERASSSHYPYNELTNTFFHSDVLYRCLRLLREQGDACKALAKALELRQPFDYGAGHSAALEDLQSSIAYLKQQNNLEWRDLLRSLRALANNLSALDHLLRSASNPDALNLNKDSEIFDREPKSLKEAFENIWQQLTPQSSLFRHALRLAIAICAGYGLMHALDLNQGFWIILTTLFVCRPNYGATRIRLIQRVTGTVFGLAASWVLFNLFPNLWIQAFFAVAAGVTFFATRTIKYTLSTAAITLMVLVCFNQIGDGYNLFLPRLADTLLGSALAGLAVFFILPDWQGRQLNKVVARALKANSLYLAQIMQEYSQGKTDDMKYRIARRNAHNADAALSGMLSNMLKEPGQFRRDTDIGFRILLLSHTLLGYISALGAHRQNLADAPTYNSLEREADQLHHSLLVIAKQLEKRKDISLEDETEITQTYRLRDSTDEEDDTLRLLQTQLLLISQQLTPLRSLAVHLLKDMP